MAEKLEGGIVEFFAEAARLEKGRNPDTVGGRLDMMLEAGNISRAQWQTMMLQDPRRSAYELKLIIAHLAGNGGGALGDDMFERVQLEGSKYFFETFSPMAHLFRRG